MIGADSFIGYAKIDLEFVDFESKINQTERRRESNKNTEHLLRIFRQVGCQHDQEEHAVIAVLSDEDALRDALVEPLDELPRALGTDTDVPYLAIHVHGVHGLHRIAAGKKFLKGAKRWWLVRLHSRGIANSEIKQFAVQFSHEQPYTDGDIFHRILLHKGQPEEAVWSSRLSVTKRKHLKQLLTKSRIVTGFRKLLEIPALWTPLELGSLNRVLPLRCDEEFQHGLAHVDNGWTAFLRGLPEFVPAQVDVESVKYLEGMAPACVSDRRLIEKKMTSGELFPRIRNAAHRKTLLGNILGYEFMIPTLHSIFDGLIQLEPACDILKKLAGPDSRATIRSCLFEAYQRSETPPVELDKGRWRRGIWQNESAQREFLYIQMWVRASREFYYMTEHTPRKVVGKYKPNVKQPNPSLEHQFGRLAMRSGFKTDVARDWDQLDVSREWAQRLCDDMEIALGEISNDARSAVAAALPRQRTSELGVDVRFLSPEPFPKERRNCRPYDNDYHSDRQSYYLYPLLHKDIAEDMPSPDDVQEYMTEERYFITSMFARRDFLFCFFGHAITSIIPTNLDNDDPYDDRGGSAHENERRQTSNSGDSNNNTPPGITGSSSEIELREQLRQQTSTVLVLEAISTEQKAQLVRAEEQQIKHLSTISEQRAELTKAREEAEAHRRALDEAEKKRMSLQLSLETLNTKLRKRTSDDLAAERSKLVSERTKGAQQALSPPSPGQLLWPKNAGNDGDDVIPQYISYSQELVAHIRKILLISDVNERAPDGLRQLPGKHGVYTVNFELPNNEWLSFADAVTGNILSSLLELLKSPEFSSWELSVVDVLDTHRAIPTPSSLDYVQRVVKEQGSLWVRRRPIGLWHVPPALKYARGNDGSRREVPGDHPTRREPRSPKKRTSSERDLDASTTTVAVADHGSQASSPKKRASSRDSDASTTTVADHGAQASSPRKRTATGVLAEIEEVE